MARTRTGLALALLAGIAALSVATERRSQALTLDEAGTINLGVRAYTDVRIHTQEYQCIRPDGSGYNGATFPCSPAGHLQQSRWFLEMKWNHDLLKYVKDWLPGDTQVFAYNLTYRGEYEGIYDYGPSEYRNGRESLNEIENAMRQGGVSEAAIQQNAGAISLANRQKLRTIAVDRNRLFQAFLDYEVGPFFVRFGRQNLAWGETDVFRLLDNINPIDNSFGGFFIDLDERRVPLDMLRSSYQLGDIGWFQQAFFEGYVADDNSVAFVPGSAPGTAFYPPLGPPSSIIGRTQKDNPVSLNHVRGGGRLVANLGDFTLGLAHYYTIFDLPAVRFRAPDFNGKDAGNPFIVPGVTQLVADQYGPHVQVTGGSFSTAAPSLQSIFRGEFAFFRAEPLFRFATASKFPGKGLSDPGFVQLVTQVLSGKFDTVSRKDTWNMALGWDMNQFIRPLNPNQSFFFTTQFFYKHVFSLDPLQAFPVPDAKRDPQRVIPYQGDQFLYTLHVDTSYNHNLPFTNTNVVIAPSFNYFYDFVGAMLFQPGVRISRDPWRFILDYSIVDSGVFRGTKIGLVRDRDNVRLQLEYVL